MKKIFNFIIPTVSVALCSTLAFTTLDSKISDVFQRVLPSTQESEDLKMINVNDDSIKNIGTWPFSRDVYAKSLITLKELGADTFVSDLSFIDESQAKVRLDYVKESLPEFINEDFQDINTVVSNFFDENSGQKLTDAKVEESMNRFFETNEEVLSRINSYIASSVVDVDESLANALSVFENSFLTLTLGDNFEVSDEEKEYLKKFIAIKNIDSNDDSLTPEIKGVQPAIQKLLSRSSGAGFVNASPDSDGYTRKVHLFLKYDGNYYGQLTIPALLKKLGNPQVVISNSEILFKDAQLNGVKKDIKIPRCEDGRVILKYPKTTYSTYKAISLWESYSISEIEASLSKNVRLMADNGFFENVSNDPFYNLTDADFELEELLKQTEDSENEDSHTFEKYLELKNAYLDSLEELFSGDVKKQLIEANSQNQEIVNYVNETFEIVESNFKKLKDTRAKLKEKVEGRILIIGTTATSTTDFGLNQYEEHFPNPGVHYTVANMILSQDFVDDSPIWISIVIAVFLCFFYVVYSVIRNTSTGRQLLIGIGMILVASLAFVGFFYVTKIYIGAAIPIISLALTFVTMTVIGFLTASKEKKYITDAFSQCLAPTVVKQLIANPDSFRLGGETIGMSAIFTDIQKFSSFSELLTAPQLVALLNYYLTRMCNIFMSEGGTIDKFEGDAIVAFVGAPYKMEDHAIRICAAALKMKAAEKVMNEEIIAIASKPQPEDMSDDLYAAFVIMVKNKKTIFTRIGINSGEITAGYMGSDAKKNYTIMGNNVNLASRLEGVNKQYSTAGILISEHTQKDLGDRFLVRSLDRVQVVNVKTPLRLYELIAEKSEASEDLLKYVGVWENFMQVFENRDYQKALEILKTLTQEKIEQYPDDKVAKYYINLIETYFIQGKYPTDKDDAGVAFNAENGVFTLLQK